MNKVNKPADAASFPPGTEVFVLGRVTNWGTTDQYREVQTADGSHQDQKVADLTVRGAAPADPAQMKRDAAFVELTAKQWAGPNGLMGEDEVERLLVLARRGASLPASSGVTPASELHGRRPKPTVAELEAILNDPTPHEVVVLPNGEIRAVPVVPASSAPQVDAREGAEPVADALRWYAEQVEGCRKLGSIGDPARQALDADGGKRAQDALARLVALPPRPGPATDGGWRDIASAPGGDILGFYRHAGQMYPDVIAITRRGSNAYWQNWPLTVPPTHWRPLPAPPEPVSPKPADAPWCQECAEQHSEDVGCRSPEAIMDDWRREADQPPADSPMTAPIPPCEATRRVSDEQVADDIAHVLDYALTVDSHFMAPAGYPADLRDSRALVADLTRENAALNRRNIEVAVLAHKWMVAHDMRVSGETYELPAVTDVPDLVSQIADLTRRLAEAERREREAWCAGRDAAAAKASDYAYTSVSDCEHRGMEEPDTGFVSCALDDVGECVCAAKIELGDKIAARILALNPPKPEGDRG